MISQKWGSYFYLVISYRVWIPEERGDGAPRSCEGRAMLGIVGILQSRRGHDPLSQFP